MAGLPPKQGEKLEAIAKRFDISVNELRRVNGIHARSTRMPKDLVVPKNARSEETLAELPLMYAPPIPTARPGARGARVKRGDTLSSIASRYRVSVASLKSWNKIGRYLQVGQKIYIR